MLRRLALILGPLAIILLTPAPLHAQRQESALSDAEVEQVREAAYFPVERILLYVKFLDRRAKAIQDLFARPRKPGREDDTHDLLEQFTSLADELNDNLDDYGPRHRDIRKALPKLIEATERWSTQIKTPPEDEAYSVSRKIALESVGDLHDEATQLVADQKAWFAAHPPAKEDNPNGVVEMPR
jgi:hypothetical protein